jgi:death-on-curing family protein
VEHIHDEVVARFWPGEQPIQPHEYRDRNLLDSAINRPFQSYGGEEFYKTIFEKSASLFHSLVCNHCFSNGNKRTAVISLDHFLCANGYVLGLKNSQLYGLALKTARHNEKRISTEGAIQTVVRSLRRFALPIEDLNRKKIFARLYQASVSARRSIRTNVLNRQEIRE